MILLKYGSLADPFYVFKDGSYSKSKHFTRSSQQVNILQPNLVGLSWFELVQLIFGLKTFC